MTPEATPEVTKVDALGLKCPLPVLRLRKRMAGLPAGALVEVLADDPASVIDVPHFCNEAGHALLNVESGAQGHRFLVQKRT